MHLPRLRRRPSASMVVALIARFAALGGVGYAATYLPAGSVGTNQLQNASVTNHKILNGSVGNFKLATAAVGPRKMENGAVGTAQINSSEVQERVTGTCTAGAVTSVTSTGAATCGTAPGLEFDASYKVNEQHTVRFGVTATVAQQSANDPFLVFPADASGAQTSDTPLEIGQGDYRVGWLISPGPRQLTA